MEKINHWFLHVDLDAFFASVEQLDNPSYKGKPVIVGGLPTDKRSVVSTASYEARIFGVHSAMPTAKAYQLCPQGIYVRGRMDRYAQISYQIMSIFKNYSPDVDQMSIDEAFIDITGTEKLFGTPEETARKIKAEVKQCTGLTVSVGLAPTKYLAKIASDINKPDGFYMIQPGQEQQFMLDLPLKKVFGVGTKTQEVLKRSGIRTTRDVYEKQLDVLQFICGKNTGTFLYNIVRGIETDRFDRKTKSHSISSETTFPVDITDTYIVETGMLELSHSIMFRLLRENGYSRTVMVKLRYEDFSTVSIQETFDRNVVTIDSLFNKACKLFEQKYEKGRGIRLIGVALENIENEEKPFQQDLFDDETEKKVAVEKAILNLEKKHPEIKIHKARMLQKNSGGKIKSILIGTLFCLMAISSSKAYAQNVSQEKGAAGLLPDTFSEETDFSQNSQKDFFNWNMDGYWKIETAGTFRSTFGNGTTFATDFSLPVFKQDIDLSANFNLNNKWFFLLNFADNFNKNTYTIKYENKSYLNLFQFSNRNITFPSEYDTTFNYSLSGGNNQAPGIKFHFDDIKNNLWKADFIARYDSTNSKSQIFYGKNKATDTKISASNFVKSRFFVIPTDYISQVQNVYIEYSNGNISDSNGIKYKKLSEQDYLTLSIHNLLCITPAALNQTTGIPRIIVTFSNDDSVTNFLHEIGARPDGQIDYSDENSYLGKIQKYFEINLDEYSYSLTAEIDGKKGIVLQNNSFYSPFIYAAKYDVGFTNKSELKVIQQYTENEYKDFQVISNKDNFETLYEDFFKLKNNYADIINPALQSDYLLPEVRYPLAKINPYIYLSGKKDSEIQILTRYYTPVSYFDIGKNASGGTVKVFINNVPENNISYESTSGFVTINSNISETDKILITWQEESSDLTNGAFSSAAGFTYKITDQLNSNISLTTRWPLYTQTNYSLSDSNNSGFVALNSVTRYEKKEFSVQYDFSLAFENNNTSGVVFLTGLSSEKNQTFYHTNYSGNNTQQDSQITGYKIPLQWNFYEDSETQQSFIDIKMNCNDLLSRSAKINLAVKVESSNLSEQDYDFIIQLGINYSDTNDQSFYYDLPQWNITQEIDFTKENEWQIVTIELSDSDRSKLIYNKDLRFIVKNKRPLTEENANGKISIGPYEPVLKGFQLSDNPNVFAISTLSTENSSPAAKNYLKKAGTSDLIEWKIIDSVSTDEKDYEIKAEKFFYPVSFENYSKINFDFKVSFSDSKNISSGTETPLCFLNLSLNDADFDSPQDFLSLKLFATEYLSRFLDDTWHTITLDANNYSLYIDNELIPQENYSVLLNKNVIPAKQTIIFTPVKNNGSSRDLVLSGQAESGAVYFSDSDFYFSAKNNVDFAYKTENIKVQIKSNQILSDGNLSADASASGNFVLGDLIFNSNIYLTSATFKNASHNFKTKKSLFNFLTFEESFLYDFDNKQSEKSDTLQTNFASFKVPLQLNLAATSKSTASSENQSISTEINYKLVQQKWNLALNSKLQLKQTSINKPQSFFNSDGNYFTEYINSTNLQFFSNLKDSTSRNINICADLKSSFFGQKLSPQFSFKIEGQTYNTGTASYEDITSAQLLIPFTYKNNNFTFSNTKTAGLKRTIAPSQSYTTDFSNLGESQNQKSWFYKTFVIMDLFDNNLAENIAENKLNTSFFTTKYDFTWKRRLYNSTKDIYIPTNASVSLTRDIRNSENTIDNYQLKISAGHSFANQLSKLNLISSISQDEFSSSFATIIKLNTNEYMISYYQNLLLIFSKTDNLRTGFDFNIQNSNNWTTRGTGIWTHNAEYTILNLIPDLIFAKTENKKYNSKRKETLNISISKNGTELKQLYDFMHTVETTMNNQYTFSGGIGTAFSYSSEKALSLGINFSLGAKISF